MKLLMENWRSYCRQDDFGLLLERYDNKQITEKHFLNTWEKQFLMEERALLEEGLWDIIKKGFSAGKEMFTNAVDKIFDWLNEKFDQFKSIVDRMTPESVKNIVSKFKSLYGVVSAWCGESWWQKVLCTIGKSILLALLLQGIIALAGALGSTVGSAQAAIQMPGGEMMSETTYETLRGALEWAQAKSFSNEALHESFSKAMEVLDMAYNSDAVYQLSELGDVINGVYNKMLSMIQSVQDAPGSEYAEVALDQLKAWRSRGFFGTQGI
tara:strand:+ start:2209 stop:3012 length:804 start_codon:yes stop_codon:yes gene_type:complete